VKNMTITRWLTYVSLGALLALPASADTRVDERRPAEPDGVVSLGNAAGKLTIVGWDKAEVAVAGSLGAGARGLDIESRGRRTSIDFDLTRGPQAEAELEIHVPSRSDVEVNGFSAVTAVSGVKGSVRVQIVSGGIRVAADGGELELHTVNGPIDVSGSSPRVRAEAVNGAVTLAGVDGDLEASAVNGKLTVEGGRFKRAELQTVSGELRVQCDLAPAARLELQSVSGRIDLSLPSAVSARFSVTTFSGEIDNELGPAAQKASGFTPQKELTFTAGNGSASVEIQTLSGAIAIRKR
jgi:hypothetical protein